MKTTLSPLSDPIEGILVVNKPLDYDYGSREFKLLIQASSPNCKNNGTVSRKRVFVVFSSHGCIEGRWFDGHVANRVAEIKGGF
ncbi:hypothetical protein CEXT_518171 [Caerostris extrusa]|uniref:Uncharacterized protein n=1 Tax=Caerostris extrusa TaxID=172846 RepID=A0AAV4SLD0_CAEEX|nr:hypothetical protein CEXT_518171 [Caerostris extrusa]